MQETQAQSQENWTEIISPHTGWFNFRLKELWRYRDLVMLFVHRDFVSVYKQTILGPLWYIIQPLFTTLTFTIIFSNIAKIPTDGMPPMLFYLSGITLWNYLSSSLTKTSNTFVSNAGIFGKVYFPRLAVPLSVIISNLLSFAIQFCFFLLFLVYFILSGYEEVRPNLHMALIPLLVMMMAGLGLGMGIIISSLTTKYRDFTYLVTFGVQLLMYATPVIYPLSSIPEKYKMYILLNPMTSLIEAFRYATIGSGNLSYFGLLYSLSFTAILLLVGLTMFNRVEKSFMDTV